MHLWYFNEMIHFFYHNQTNFNHFSTDCFQFETIIHLPEIGVPLVHMLGAIISGSQVFYLVSTLFWFIYAYEFTILFFILINCFGCRWWGLLIYFIAKYLIISVYFEMNLSFGITFILRYSNGFLSVLESSCSSFKT